MNHQFTGMYPGKCAVCGTIESVHGRQNSCGEEKEMKIKFDEARCYDCGREFIVRPLHDNVQVGDRVYCPCPNNGSLQSMDTEEAPCNRHTMGTVTKL